MSSTMRIDISKVRRDGGTQSREELNQNTVDEYGASMVAGDSFPAVKVFYDGTWYWLADGFHRVAAALQIKATTIFADVHQGTQRDAVLDSVAANSKHGLRRTRDDVRRAIKTLLRDEEWGKWSDREIARKVNCDHKTVGSVRSEMVSSGEITQTDRTVERNGTVYQMTPATKPMVTNAVGRGFAIGDVVRFSEQGIWEYNYGQIADINGEDVVLNFALKSRREPNSKPETITISRLKLFPVAQKGYLYWFCHALYQERVVLFAWKDHYISFDVPSEINRGGHNFTLSDGDMGLAWRVHPAWLEYWSNQSISYVVVKQEDINPELLDMVSRAGRARGGTMVMPPQPQPEAKQITPEPAAKEIESVQVTVPEWAVEGAMVKHASGKICRIERIFTRRFPEGVAFRVEIIKPEEGFAIAPAREFEPYQEPAAAPEPEQKTVIRVGDRVLTRAGQHGTVLEISGCIANVQCKGYANPHKIETLKPAPETADNPGVTPLMTDDELSSLDKALSAIVNFIENPVSTDGVRQSLNEVRKMILRVEQAAWMAEQAR